MLLKKNEIQRIRATLIQFKAIYHFYLWLKKINYPLKLIGKSLRKDMMRFEELLKKIHSEGLKF